MKLAPWLKRVLMILLFLALLAGQSWATYRFFTSRFPGGNDFYGRWACGCALIWTGQNPYSDEVTLQTQIGMHGRPAQPGEDIAAFWYPLYTLFLFWPLCFIRFYPVVQAIWMTLMLHALLVGVVLTARVTRWRAGTWMWGVTLLWSVLNYPHARAIILGQIATVVFLGLALALWALDEQKDDLAGAFLAITTVKPQMSFLLIPWILWWAAWRRRWKVWRGFLLAMVLLVSVSLLLVPTWVGDFVGQVRAYSDSPFTQQDTLGEPPEGLEGQPGSAKGSDYGSLVWIVTRHFLKLGPVAEIVGVLVFASYVVWASWRERQAKWDGFVWMTGLVLIVTNFIAPRAATPHYTMLLLPLFAWFDRLKQRIGQGGVYGIVSIQTALLTVQWYIFLTTIRGDFETPLVYLPYPVLMLAVHLLAERHLPEIFS